MRDGKFIAHAALAFVAVLWLGLLLGVSVLATPVKFQAQSLALPVALDVGQVTFALFSKVEWVFAMLTAGCLRSAKPGRGAILVFVVLLAIVATQASWLLTVLDVRLDAVIAGWPPSSSSHHLLYIVAEAAKALLLLTLALAAFGRMAADQREVSPGTPKAQLSRQSR